MKLFRKLSKIFLIIVGIISTGAILTACGAHNTAKSELIQPHYLTIGMEGQYPPYSYHSHGKLDGYEVGVAKAIAKQLHLKPKFKETQWDGLLSGLGAKRYDVVLNDISVVNGTPRAKHFISSIPYMYSRSVLITSSHNHKIKNLYDIKGQKFGEGVGTGNWRIAKKFGAHPIPSPSFAADIEMIEKGRTKGSVNSVDAFKGYAKQHSTKGLRAYAVPSSQSKNDKIAVLLAKHSPKLKNKINKALRKLRKNGTLKRLAYKYLGFNETINKSSSGVISDKK